MKMAQSETPILLWAIFFSTVCSFTLNRAAQADDRILPHAAPALASPQPTHSTSPVSSPSPLVTIPANTPTITPGSLSADLLTTGESLTAGESKTLLKSFKKAQETELKSEMQRQRSENKDLDYSQRSRKREFEAKSKLELRAMFSGDTKRDDRRHTIQDNVGRREALLQLFIDEKKKKKEEQSSRLQSIREDQRFKLKEFKSLLDQNKRPTQDLWPQAGR